MVAVYEDRQGKTVETNDLLREFPHSKTVLLRCVKAWQALGEHKRALSVSRGALSTGDETAELHEAAAISCAEMQDYAGAVAHLRVALRLFPASIPISMRLARALMGIGKLPEAQALLHHITRNAPHLANAWYLLAQLLSAKEDQKGALSCCLRTIQCDSHHVDAMLQAGDILASEAYAEGAMELYQRMMLVRSSATGWMRIAASQHAQGLLEDAERSYRQAIALDAGDVDAQIGLGKILMQRGQSEAARDYFEAALRMRPEMEAAQLALTILMEHNGQREEARSRVYEWLEKSPNHPGFLGLKARLTCGDDEKRVTVAQIEARLHCGGLPKDLACSLHFEAGRLADALGDFPNAFRYIAVGNVHRKREKRYRRESTERGFEELRRVFTSAFLNRAPRAPGGERTPIFIVGMPRSGGSLAEQILASHPNVYGAGELWELEMVVRRRPQNEGDHLLYPMRMAEVDRETLATMASTYWANLPNDARGASFVTDKMPHNFEHIGSISLLFPNARIIHCQRHPLDVGISCFMQNFSEANAFSHDLADCGFFYRQYAALMDHWRLVLTKPFFELPYETLVTDPEPTVRALLDYCGLSWNDSCLRFHENKRVVHTASYQQVREPFYTGSVGRWRHYASYLRPLVEELGDLVSEEDRARVLSAAEKAGTAGEGASQAGTG